VFDSIRQGHEDGFDVAANREGASAETIGQRLRRLRTERRFSQRELSSPGVSYAYISRIEAGTRQPSVKALRMLARKLGVTADYLETGSDLTAAAQRELHLADAEIRLRLDEDRDAAEKSLRELLEDATAAGDIPAALRARIALGLSAASRDEHGEAVELLEGAIEAAGLLPSERPDVFATLGHSYSVLGRGDQAVQLFERSLEDATRQAPDDAAMQVRFATYLSYALTDLGDLKRAETVMKDALDRAGDAADPYTRVRLYWSLARLSELEGKSAAALDYVRRAIALLETTEDNLHLARAHVLCAWIMGLQGKDAEHHLAVAERLFGPRPDRSDLALLLIEQARRAVLVEDGDTAVARAQEALELLGDQHGAEQGSASWAYADGLALRGETDAANEAYRRAVDLMAENRSWREAAQACRSWGKVLRRAGRESEALDVLERATDLAVRDEVVETSRKT
jgi:transcriptional regulator with XRE-family HTH domain